MVRGEFLYIQLVIQMVIPEWQMIWKSVSMTKTLSSSLKIKIQNLKAGVSSPHIAISIFTRSQKMIIYFQAEKVTQNLQLFERGETDELWQRTDTRV